MLFDSTGAPLFATVFPQRVYADFDLVPRVVADSLLFIEDRYLLDANEPNRNPAIDWGRFGRAVADRAASSTAIRRARAAARSRRRSRSSAIRPRAAPRRRPKLRQIASASVRAYLNGPQTMLARRTIVALPELGAARRTAAYRQITGIGDGLAAWYGRDFNDVNRILSAPTTGDNVDEQGKTFREVLSLIIAQRAPSYFSTAATRRCRS